MIQASGTPPNTQSDVLQDIPQAAQRELHRTRAMQRSRARRLAIGERATSAGRKRQEQTEVRNSVTPRRHAPHSSAAAASPRSLRCCAVLLADRPKQQPQPTHPSSWVSQSVSMPHISASMHAHVCRVRCSPHAVCAAGVSLQMAERALSAHQPTRKRRHQTRIRSETDNTGGTRASGRGVRRAHRGTGSWMGRSSSRSAAVASCSIQLSLLSLCCGLILFRQSVSGYERNHSQCQ